MGKKGLSEEFFAEQAIVLEIENGETLRAFMRPLRVKEIPIACRIAKLQENQAGETEYLPHLIKLVEGTIDINIDGLPMTVLNQLIDIFIDFNFGSEKANAGAYSNTPVRKAVPVPSRLAIAFDFLIHQGHTFNDILEYTLPQVRLFQQVAVDRLTGTKRVDPITALTAAGVKLKR